MLRIKLVKSTIAQTPRNRATVKALGLRKTHSVVLQPDTPSIRGMIHHVKHMLEVTVVEDAPATAAPVTEAAPKAKKTKKAETTEETK